MTRTHTGTGRTRWLTAHHGLLRRHSGGHITNRVAVQSGPAFGATVVRLVIGSGPLVVGARGVGGGRVLAIVPIDQ